MSKAARHVITRRSLVAAAASAVAAPAAAGHGAADPVLAAIAAHRAARAALDAAARHLCDVEEGLVDDTLDRGSGPDDDPVLRAALAAFDKACEADSRTAWALARARPSGRAALAALLRYAGDVEADGEAWPDPPYNEDGRLWVTTFHHNLAAVVERMGS